MQRPRLSRSSCLTAEKGHCQQGHGHLGKRWSCLESCSFKSAGALRPEDKEPEQKRAQEAFRTAPGTGRGDHRTARGARRARQDLSSQDTWLSGLQHAPCGEDFGRGSAGGWAFGLQSKTGMSLADAASMMKSMDVKMRSSSS